MPQKPETALSQTARRQDLEWEAYVDTLKPADGIPFEEQWARFNEIYKDRPAEDGPPQIWRPGRDTIEHSNMSSLMRKQGLNTYADLYAWSAADRAAFWDSVIRELGIVMQKPPETVYDGSRGVEDPAWLPGALFNITDSCFKSPADQPAIVAGEEDSARIRTVSYQSLENMINRFANGLRGHGFREGDCIALYMPMNLECVAAYLGVIRAGCTVISIADSFQAPEVKKRLNIGNAGAIVTVSSFKRSGKTVRLYETVKKSEAPPAIVLYRHGDKQSELRPEDMSWNDFISRKTGFDSVTGDPDRTSNILFSSGTTGTPKAIPWTQLTPIKCAMDGRYHQDIRHTDRVCWPSNIGWMMGPWLVYATLINGATIALYDGAPNREGFVRFVQDAGVTILGTVPSLVKAWRAISRDRRSDWSRIRLFSSTGEPSSRQDYTWLMSRSGYKAPVIEYCGGTEIGGGYITGSVLRPASPATFTTPALGLDFALLNPRGGEVKPGEMGEIYIIPPSIGLSQKLLNKDHHREYYADCPSGPKGAVLRRHGDQIMKMAHGFYKARGRSDDAMNLGGIKVGAPEIESIINSHSDVYESAAVSVSREDEGQDMLAVFAVLNSSRQKADLLAELNRLIAEQLNPLFKIHVLEFIDNLPKTATNKIMRRELRKQFPL